MEEVVGPKTTGSGFFIHSVTFVASGPDAGETNRNTRGSKSEKNDYFFCPPKKYRCLLYVVVPA